MPGIPPLETAIANEARLSVQATSKTFGRTKVLDGVSLEVQAGEIHGLVGQNGSGKSTLIKLLSGFYAPDPGSSFSIDGEPLHIPVSPSELQERGIAFVHQNLGLDLEANVIENVRIGRFDINRLTRRIRWNSEASRVSRTLTSLGAGDVNPYSIVGSLTHAERASVAIARALQGIEPGAGCIVFDESTQSLPREILQEFYEQVRRIARSGTAIVIVSHRLDEVIALCDTVTVLEDGKVTVAAHSTEGLDEAELTRLILGRTSESRRTSDVSRDAPALGEVVLEAVDVSTGSGGSASFAVRAGEIVGLIGPSDSGYDDLPYVLAGARPGVSGSVLVRGKALAAKRMTPSQLIAAGLGFVPGDRGGQGLALELSALENVSLPRVNRSGNRLSLQRGWQLNEFLDAVARLGITPNKPDLPAGAFSGGNQQKMLIAKWLLNGPAVLVLHEPTQAVDVGARADILGALRAQADNGIGVLISSLETDDLAATCDRILIMRDGEIAQEITGPGISSHTLIDAVYAEINTESANAAA